MGNVKAQILVINGPNLNMLGIREPDIYGNLSLEMIENQLQEYIKDKNINLEFFQSNHEGEIIDRIHKAYNNTDIIIINAGAFTHYSIAIYDALKAVEIPVIEVHLSNIFKREEFRYKSLITPIAVGGVFGFGAVSYKLALDAAVNYLDCKG